MSGPCLSSSVADHPLRPATRRRLGRPLPHQQADRPRAPPPVPEGFHSKAMRPRSSTRYYTAVRPAIPRRRASCSRVTHQSATNFGEQALLRSFDLHVLGTPPAFVLSQDQTLQKRYSTSSSERLIRPNHKKSEYFPQRQPSDRPSCHRAAHLSNPVSLRLSKSKLSGNEKNSRVAPYCRRATTPRQGG